MQLHALDLFLVPARRPGHLLHVVRHQGDLLGEAVPLAGAAHAHADAGLEALDLLSLALLGVQEHLAEDGARVVRDPEGHKRLAAAAQLLALDLLEHKALDAHAPARLVQVADGVGRAARDLAAVEHARALGLFLLLDLVAHVLEELGVHAPPLLEEALQLPLLLAGDDLHRGVPAEDLREDLPDDLVRAAQEQQVRGDLGAHGEGHGVLFHRPRSAG